MSFGPVQLLVIGFPTDHFTGEIMAELDRLREHNIVRLIDLMVVTKDSSGEVRALERTDLSPGEASRFGEIVGALIGLGTGADEPLDIEPPGAALTDEEVWYVADEIPPGTTAAVALLEHVWATPLRDAVIRNGGIAVADNWVHPEDLVVLGAVLEDASGRPV